MYSYRRIRRRRNQRGIKIIDNNFVECGVQSIYVRAGFSTIVNSNISKNCGYGRLTSGTFNPAHIWLENGQYTANDNKMYQTKVEPGDEYPDGMRITSLVGDATSLFPAKGDYFCTALGNMILSSKNISTGSSLGLFNYGIRTNSNIDCSNSTIDGTQSYSMWVQNDDSFGAGVPSNFNASNSTLVNADISNSGITGVIHVTKFGEETTGNVENIHATNVTLNQALNVITFNTNLNTHSKININHGTGNIFSRYSTLGPFTMSSGLKRQDNHGLGEKPKLVQAYLVCTLNNLGWQTGDECSIDGLQCANGSEGIMYGYDATKVTTIVGSAANPIRVLNRAEGSEGNVGTVDLNRWQLYYRCYV